MPQVYTSLRDFHILFFNTNFSPLVNCAALAWVNKQLANANKCLSETTDVVGDIKRITVNTETRPLTGSSQTCKLTSGNNQSCETEAAQEPRWQTTWVQDQTSAQTVKLVRWWWLKKEKKETIHIYKI